MARPKLVAKLVRGLKVEKPWTEGPITFEFIQTLSDMARRRTEQAEAEIEYAVKQARARHAAKAKGK